MYTEKILQNNVAGFLPSHPTTGGASNVCLSAGSDGSVIGRHGDSEVSSDKTDVVMTPKLLAYMRGYLGGIASEKGNAASDPELLDTLRKCEKIYGNAPSQQD